MMLSRKDFEYLENLTQEQKERMKRLIVLATELHGDTYKARLWIRDSVYGLGGKRPMDMILNEEDHETVCDLIGRLKHGIPT